MKAGRIILKWMIITMLAFITFNLFISSDYEFERSIEIESPIDSVYNQVSDLHNWPNWAVWWKKDLTIFTEYFGEKRGKGASMKWKGEEVGAGGLKIVDCSPYRIEIELNLGSMTPSGFWKFEEIG